MYYSYYLFAIALLVMIGQLAFALYQVASFLLSWTRATPDPNDAGSQCVNSLSGISAGRQGGGREGRRTGGEDLVFQSQQVKPSNQK
jgi:hypothetical protein